MWNPLSWVMEAAAIMAIALAHGGRDIRGKVLHNGKWMEEDAAVLVPGDIISIKLADIVPADAHLLEGDALKIDQQEEITSPDPPLPEPEKCTVHSFCKILIASDSSTHGGFSVLRRHADECLPPLDMSQQPPWQELVATNLHGNEWHFRHNFRGNEHIIVQVYSNKLEISTFPLIETQSFTSLTEAKRSRYFYMTSPYRRFLGNPKGSGHDPTSLSSLFASSKGQSSRHSDQSPTVVLL